MDDIRRRPVFIKCLLSRWKHHLTPRTGGLLQT